MDTEVTSVIANNNWSTKIHGASSVAKGKNNDSSYFKFVGKKFVINSLLIINFLTTFLVVALILRLKLLEDHKLFEIGLNMNENAEDLVINGDVLADTLIPGADLMVERLSADRVEIRDPRGKAAILLDKENILLEAESYTLDELGSPISFKLKNRVESLQVPNGMKNVKYIRAPVTRQSWNSDSAGDLVVEADEEGLELSGNLGVRGHSSEVRLDASREIHLESWEESIHISASEAIFLSSQLPHENSYNVSHLRGLRKDNKLLGSRQLVLVEPESGQVYLD